MRFKITASGFPTLTISKMKAGDKLYAERNSMIASSPLGSGSMERRRLMITELQGTSYDTGNQPTQMAGIMAAFRSTTKQTLDRQRIGERSYVLYEAKADDQKVTFRSCFPGTIMRWKATPLAGSENYVYPEVVGFSSDVKSVFEENDDDRPHGVFMAVTGSFLVAELSVRSKVYHTGNVSVKKFSGTDDSFQRFEGDGNVFLEVHGDLQEIPLYPGESVDVWPGHLLGFTEGVDIEMKSAGDISLRNEENNDYVIHLTAGNRGGYVYVNSVRVDDFFSRYAK